MVVASQQKKLRIVNISSGVEEEGYQKKKNVHRNSLLFNVFYKQSKKNDRLDESNCLCSYLNLSSDERYLLVNTNISEIHLWDLQTKQKVQKYTGHSQTVSFVGGCFGGISQNFVVSGSEDSQIYIWHRMTGSLLSTLSGHAGIVNMVAWSPKNSKLLVSCSDDHTIRFWS